MPAHNYRVVRVPGKIQEEAPLCPLGDSWTRDSDLLPNPDTDAAPAVAATSCRMTCTLASRPATEREQVGTKKSLLKSSPSNAASTSAAPANSVIRNWATAVPNSSSKFSTDAKENSIVIATHRSLSCWTATSDY